MKQFFVLVFCVVPLISARSFGGRETDTCIADYLKSKGLIGNEFGSTKPLNPLCEVIVEVTKSNILASVQQEILNDKDMSKESECVMESLKNSDFGNSLLLIYVYETSDNIANEEMQKKLKLAKSQVTHATFNSFMSCQADKKFTQIFDSLLNGDDSSSEEETDEKEDYCIRKHIIDNNLINKNHFKLQLNPKNLDTSAIDCNVLYQKALKDAEDELVKALLEDDDSSEEQDVNKMKIDPSNVTCVLESIRKGNFIDQMLHFDYIKEYDLTPVKKEELRLEFVNVMTRLAEKSSDCFL